MPRGHSSRGFRSTKYSRLFGVDQSVPSSGPPSWLSTLFTSGKERKRSVMRGTTPREASLREMLGGSVKVT